MKIMAQPSNQAFIVSENNMRKFRDERTSKSDWKQIEQMAKNFDKYNLKP